MMGVRMPETCRAVHKRQVINFRNCCICLVDLYELLVDNPVPLFVLPITKFQWPNLY
jgi:hypothetical protein